MARYSTLSRRCAVAVLALALTAAVMTACGAQKTPVAHPRAVSRKAGHQATAKPPKPDPIAVEQALLDARAEGIRTHNLALFLSSDDPQQPGFIARDRAYFAAASDLPWKVFQYQVTATPWPQQLIDPAWGRSPQLPEVVFNTQVAGFDPTVLSRTTGFAFVTRRGHTYIASDETVHNHLFPGYQPDPWDVEPVMVLRAPNVIAVFDRTAAKQSAMLMTSLNKAIAGVSADLPYAWNKKVIMYAIASSTFASAMATASGGDLSHLGAVTYALDPAVPDGDRRILLLGDALDSGAGPLAQTIRHEVTHMALGKRDDHIPLWLVEGIAEYEGAKAIPEAIWQMPESAIQRAAHAPGGMPATATFHDADQDWNYALSWMACEYIVQKGGEPLLWALLDAMDNRGIGTADPAQNAILEQVLGMNDTQLAVHAAELIRSTYG
jgi:hypothetical protein